MDEIIIIKEKNRTSCPPRENLEYWASIDIDAYIKITEGIYRIQLMYNHGFKEGDYAKITKQIYVKN